MKLYLCGIAAQHELGQSLAKISLAKDLESFKEAHKCWKECGIVSVEVSNPEWIEPQKIGSRRHDLPNL